MFVFVIVRCSYSLFIVFIEWAYAINASLISGPQW